MLKLLKPLYPARGFGYSPTYKNYYQKKNGFSVVGQVFGQNSACILKDGTGGLVPPIGGVCPVGYISIYEYFGMKGHSGLDIGCVTETPVFASLEGFVNELQLETARGLGISIISDWLYEWEGGTDQIKHRYWHLKEMYVKLGDRVKAGDLIGLADTTGYATGPHLHFEVKPVRKVNNEYLNVVQGNGFYGAIDPLPYIIEKLEFNLTRNLAIGMSGEDVKNLQIFLAYEGFLGQVGFAGFTGYFGTQTLEAVRMFQKKYGILTTGFVGPITRSAISKVLNS